MWSWHNNVSPLTSEGCTGRWKVQTLLVFQRRLTDLKELAPLGVVWEVVVVFVWLIIDHKCFVFAECQPGFFKAEMSSSNKCERCPANTQELTQGALFCPCENGFYRAPKDPVTGPCSGEDVQKIKKNIYIYARIFRFVEEMNLIVSDLLLCKKPDAKGFRSRMFLHVYICWCMCECMFICL